MEFVGLVGTTLVLLLPTQSLTPTLSLAENKSVSLERWRPPPLVCEGQDG